VAEDEETMKRGMVLGWMTISSFAYLHSQHLAPIVICMEMTSNQQQLKLAQELATQIFATIGVRVEFHRYHSCPQDEGQPIFIALRNPTSSSLRPGALAYAEPFGGTHIRIFLDRVEKSVNAREVSSLLAHVIVHEVTHVVERSDGHSEGIMKERWDRSDYSQMRRGPLAFSETDIAQIRLSLSLRRERKPGTER
jgi:hypothetical protein